MQVQMRWKMVDLQPILDRLAKATAGPWEVNMADPQSVTISSRSPDYDTEYMEVNITWSKHGEADADFIAHAPEDMAALIDEVQRLRSELGWCK